MMKNWLGLLLLLPVFGLVGCGGDAVVEDETETPEAPAVAEVELPVSADTPPEEVVSAFLDAIRAGDADTDSGAEQAKIARMLLTQTAREETAKANLVVAPPGSPGSTYEIRTTRMVTEEGAHVTTRWTEKDLYGGSTRFDIVWIVRKSEEGWRVSGMATQADPNAPPLLLDFEKPVDMLAKIDAAEEELKNQPRRDAQADRVSTLTSPTIIE